MLVASDAPEHSRHLIARGELELLHLAVALRTANISRGVRLVVKNHVRARELELCDAIAVGLSVADMAKGARRSHVGVRSRHYSVQVSMIGAVATVTRRGFRRELVRDRLARSRSFVTRRAREI